MKVKCREYEGILIDLSASYVTTGISGKFYCDMYDLTLKINNYTEIRLSDVRNEEIEFIKESRNDMSL